MQLDQLLVASLQGLRELGAYFVITQCAMLITFVPQRISQVMLASFSKLISLENQNLLISAYKKVCRLVIMSGTIIALGLIIFSLQISQTFGSWFAERHLYLVFLSLLTNIGCIGNVNAMLIIGKEKMGPFLINSIILILIQLIVTVILLKPLGIYGIIVGKLTGMCVGQTGLFIIIHFKLKELKLYPPKEYWISQFIVIISVLATWYSNGIKLYYAIPAYIILSLSFLLAIKFKPSEVLSLFRNR